MDAFLFLLLGIGGSTLIAAMSMGVVLTYRASGVINFAAGGTAAFVAYAYWSLSTQGVLFVGIPIPITPNGEPLPAWLALIISIVIAALLGYLQYLLVYRFLRTASALAKIVASSGILLVLQASILLSFGADTRVVPTFIPPGQIMLGSAPLSYAAIVAAVFTVIVAVGLTLLFQRTQFGIRTRAAADNRKGALLVGTDPDILEAINWTLSTVVLGIIGIVVTPMIGLQAGTITLYIVPVLAAALVARFTSFWIAAVAGFAIGSLQALVTWTQGMSWFPIVENVPLPGVTEALPFVIIAVILIFRGSSLPSRATEAPPRLPRAPRPNHLWIRFGVAIVGALLLIVFAPFDYRQALVTSMIGMVVILPFVIVTGYLGLINLAQMAVAGAAGFVLSKATHAWGLPDWLGVLVALTAAVALSVLVALPALRMRGMQLAIITLAGAAAIEAIWFDNPYWGGGQSTAPINPPSIFGIPLGASDSFWVGDGTVPTPGFALFVLVIAVACALAVVFVRRSRLGARMLAVRGNESATAAAGISVTVVKFLAFAIAGLIAGIAGILYGYNFGVITTNRFTVMMAIGFLAIAYLGGITTVTGAVIGGLLVSQGILMHLVTTLFGISSDFQLLFAGLAVLVTVTANPDGIAGFFRDAWHGFLQRVEARRVGAQTKEAAQ